MGENKKTLKVTEKVTKSKSSDPGNMFFCCCIFSWNFFFCPFLYFNVRDLEDYIEAINYNY